MKSSFWFFGSKLTILKSEKETGSAFDLIEGLFLPGSESPLHVHANYSETFYVLEGEVTIYTPGNETVLRGGESFTIPKNVPHSIINNSKEKSFKALCVTAPSAFAQLIRTVGITATEEEFTPPAQNQDMELAGKTLVEIGDAILGPPGARP